MLNEVPKNRERAVLPRQGKMKCMCYSPLGQRWERVQHPVSLVEKTNFKSGGTCMEPPPRRQEAEEAVGGMGGVPPQC